MSWKEKAFRNFRLYAVTDFSAPSDSCLKKIEAAYRGGADIVQLRSKEMTDAQLLRLGLKLSKIAASYKKLFFVNDRLDLAIATGADGLHLGQDDMPVRDARRISLKIGRRLWIGKSTHNLNQGLRALEEKPDYLGVGPVFKTPTKPGYRPAGLRYVSQAAERFLIPFVAIGGICEENIGQVIAAGATRIAMVRAVFDAPNVERAVQSLCARIDFERRKYAHSQS